MKAPSKLDQLRALREAKAVAAAMPQRLRERVTAHVTPVTSGVTPAGRVTSDVTPLHAMAGELCPLCGHRIPQTPAAKQAAYRARRKGNA